MTEDILEALLEITRAHNVFRVEMSGEMEGYIFEFYGWSGQLVQTMTQQEVEDYI